MNLHLDIKTFSHNEFSGLKLKDKRLSDRVVKIATIMNEAPQLSFPNAYQGKKKDLKSFYRFFQNKKITDQTILEKHYRNTILRCIESKGPILLVTDSVFMAPAKKHSMKGLKTKGIGENNSLRIHYMIAVQANTGEVLGITKLFIIGNDVRETYSSMRQECDIWALITRVTLDQARSYIKKKGLYEEFKSRLIFVADREADTFHLFEDLKKMDINFIIRSAYKRELVDKETGEIDLIPNLKHREILHETPFTIEVYKGQKKEKLKVQRSIHINKIVLPPQRNRSRKARKHNYYTPKELNMVFIREIDEVNSKNAMDWKIFTNMDITSPEHSKKVVTYYQMRWKIEELNKCAKSGVMLERRQFTKLSHLKPAISLIFVTAWRLLCIRDIASRKKIALAKDAFSRQELEYLHYRLEKKINTLTVKDAMNYIAEQGGYLGQQERSGWIVLWKGLLQFLMEVKGFFFAKEIFGIS